MDVWIGGAARFPNNPASKNPAIRFLIYGIYETTKFEPRLHEARSLAAWDGLVCDGFSSFHGCFGFQVEIAIQRRRAICFGKHCGRLWPALAAGIPPIPLQI